MGDRSSTDDQVGQLVREALRSDRRFEGSAIDVSVRDGRATLSGLVSDPPTRAAAVAVARRTRGVRDVVDRLRVQPFVPRFDADITADVVSAITLQAVTNPAKIDVQTSDGVVYLHGTVPDPTVRQMVDSLARSIDGVRDVVNALGVEIAVPRPDAAVRRAIDEWLRRFVQPAVVDRLQVAVHAGIAYLHGEVETTALRWAIEDLVRWVPGVVDVVDELSGPAEQRRSATPGQRQR